VYGGAPGAAREDPPGRAPSGLRGELTGGRVGTGAELGSAARLPEGEGTRRGDGDVVNLCALVQVRAASGPDPGAAAGAGRVLVACVWEDRDVAVWHLGGDPVLCTLYTLCCFTRSVALHALLLYTLCCFTRSFGARFTRLPWRRPGAARVLHGAAALHGTLRYTQCGACSGASVACSAVRCSHGAVESRDGV
jgi:hypothetical protein